MHHHQFNNYSPFYPPHSLALSNIYSSSQPISTNLDYTDSYPIRGRVLVQYSSWPLENFWALGVEYNLKMLSKVFTSESLTDPVTRITPVIIFQLHDSRAGKLRVLHTSFFHRYVVPHSNSTTSKIISTYMGTIRWDFGGTAQENKEVQIQTPIGRNNIVSYHVWTCKAWTFLNS